MSDLKQTIATATTTAMKARDKQRVGVFRMVNAEIKRVEVDERQGDLGDHHAHHPKSRQLVRRAGSSTQEKGLDSQYA